MRETATEVPTIDISALLPSWQRSLRAANRSPRTVQSYTEAATQLSEYLIRQGMPTAVDSVRREHVESFIEDLQARFRSTTVAARFRSLQQLFKWLLEEGEVTTNPMVRMRAPRVDEAPPAVLSDAELRALLNACEGPGVAERRDTAILRGRGRSRSPAPVPAHLRSCLARCRRPGRGPARDRRLAVPGDVAPLRGSTRVERAREAHRRLSPGDRL